MQIVKRHVSIKEQVALRNRQAAGGNQSATGRNYPPSVADAKKLAAAPKRVTPQGSLASEERTALAALACWKAAGLPVPVQQFKFHPSRKWKFDFAFPNFKGELKDASGEVVAHITLPDACGGIAIEVQGGVFGIGRPCPRCKQRKQCGHNRGASMLKEYEKWRAAAELGWFVLPITPQLVTSPAFIAQLKRILQRDVASTD